MYNYHNHGMGVRYMEVTEVTETLESRAFKSNKPKPKKNKEQEERLQGSGWLLFLSFHELMDTCQHNHTESRHLLLYIHFSGLCNTAFQVVWCCSVRYCFV